MSFIGTNGAERLDKSNASLGLIKAKEKAVCLLKNNVDMHTIKLQTGWETSVDGKWRYEIENPFHSNTEIEDYSRKHFGENILIRLYMKDTILLTAYPAFERLSLFALYSPTKNFAGYFDSSRYTMLISMGNKNDSYLYQIEDTLLHEVQHLIQEEEGFARGGNPEEWGRNRYMRLAGEVEARNASFRHHLSCEERRQKLRTDTQDVPDSAQIITFG